MQDHSEDEYHCVETETFTPKLSGIENVYLNSGGKRGPPLPLDLPSDFWDSVGHCSKVEIVENKA